MKPKEAEGIRRRGREVQNMFLMTNVDFTIRGEATDGGMEDVDDGMDSGCPSQGVRIFLLTPSGVGADFFAPSS